MRSGLRGGVRGHYVHLSAGATVARELHVAVGEREQRVVLAEPDVQPGEETRATLPHEDVAGQHVLPAEALDAEALRIRLAVVLGRGLALFVRHRLLL